MTKWFYKENKIIKGPVSTEGLMQIIYQFQDPKKTYIWCRGNPEWVTADRWQPQDPNLNTEQPEPSSPMTETAAKPEVKTEIKPTDVQRPPSKPIPTENLFSIHDVKKVSASTSVSQPLVQSNKQFNLKPETSNEKYRVQLNFIDQNLMTEAELMAFASQVENPTEIAIFDPETKQWKEIYSFKKIVEKLGLTRRKTQRVPILAQFTGSSSRHNQFSARLVTISLGGLGLTDVFDLKIGDNIYGQITSPHFYSPVAIEAEAIYCGTDGYVGLKFSQINDDAQSLVTDYVKRFSQNE